MYQRFIALGRVSVTLIMQNHHYRSNIIDSDDQPEYKGTPLVAGLPILVPALLGMEIEHEALSRQSLELDLYFGLDFTTPLWDLD